MNKKSIIIIALALIVVSVGVIVIAKPFGSTTAAAESALQRP